MKKSSPPRTPKPAKSSTFAVKIFGSSYNTLEIAGDFSLTIHPVAINEDYFLRFSDGTYLKANYNDEDIWRVVCLSGEGVSMVKRAFGLPTEDDDIQSHGDSDAPFYSDVITILSEHPIMLTDHGHNPIPDVTPESKLAKQLVDVINSNDSAWFAENWNDLDTSGQNSILTQVAAFLKPLINKDL